MRSRPPRTREPFGDAALATNGQTIPEYALILALIALIGLIGLLVLAGHIGSFGFDKTHQPPTTLRPPVATCDPNYAGACVPPYPPDIDCSDLHALGIDTVRVVGSDPHKLDPDHDGIGCN